MIELKEEYINKFMNRRPKESFRELVLALAMYFDDSKQLTRTINGLLRQGINSLDELMETDVKKIRNLGEVSLNAIRQVKGLEVKPIARKVYLSNYSYEELIELRSQINKEILKRDLEIMANN